MKINRMLVVCMSVLLLCLAASCNQAPTLENPQAISYKNNHNELGIYNFTFNFINSGTQALEIIAVTAYDQNQQKLQHDPEFIASLGGIPPEVLTHYIPNSTFPLKDFAKRFRVDLSATPLLGASAVITPGNGAIQNQYSQEKFEITPQSQIIQSRQKIVPARYTILTGKTYEKITLKIQYKIGDEIKELIQNFDKIERKMS